MLSRRAAGVPAPGQGKCGSEQGEPRGSGCAGSVLLISTLTDFWEGTEKCKSKILGCFTPAATMDSNQGLLQPSPAGLLELRCGKGESAWRGNTNHSCYSEL